MNRLSEVKKKVLFFLIMMRGNWKNVFLVIFYIFLLSSIFWCPGILYLYGIWLVIKCIYNRVKDIPIIKIKLK